MALFEEYGKRSWPIIESSRLLFVSSSVVGDVNKRNCDLILFERDNEEKYWLYPTVNGGMHVFG